MMPMMKKIVLGMFAIFLFAAIAYALEPITTQISLKQGPNNVNFEVLPTEKGLSKVLVSISGEYRSIRATVDGVQMVWNEKLQGLPYIPNELKNLDYETSYVIDMKKEAILTVRGFPKEGKPYIAYRNPSSWRLVECKADDTGKESRTSEAYDYFTCETVFGKEKVEERAASCDFCVPKSVSEEKWEDIPGQECLNGRKPQLLVRKVYDENGCYAKTKLQSDYIETKTEAIDVGSIECVTICVPKVVEIKRGWEDISECLPDDSSFTKQQIMTIYSYDANRCTLDTSLETEKRFTACVPDVAVSAFNVGPDEEMLDEGIQVFKTGFNENVEIDALISYTGNINNVEATATIEGPDGSTRVVSLMPYNPTNDKEALFAGDLMLDKNSALGKYKVKLSAKSNLGGQVNYNGPAELAMDYVDVNNGRYDVRISCNDAPNRNCRELVKERGLTSWTSGGIEVSTHTKNRIVLVYNGVYETKDDYLVRAIKTDNIKIIGESRDGVILRGSEEWHTPIVLDRSNNIFLEKLTMEHGYQGVYADASKNLVFKDVKMSNNKYNGLEFQSFDESADKKDNILITSSEFTNNNRGLRSTNMNNLVVKKSKIVGNKEGGIDIDPIYIFRDGRMKFNGGNNIIIYDNNIRDNADFFSEEYDQFGVSLGKVNTVELARNTIDNNKYLGIWIYDNSKKIIMRNNIISGSEFALAFTDVPESIKEFDPAFKSPENIKVTGNRIENSKNVLTKVGSVNEFVLSDNTFICNECMYRTQIVGQCSGSDATSPGRINDLRVYYVDGNVPKLTWTAPGDDGNVGKAKKYIVKLSRDNPITDADKWVDLPTFTPNNVPLEAGSKEEVVIRGQGAKDFRYFVIKAVDDNDFISPISNNAEYIS